MKKRSENTSRRTLSTPGQEARVPKGKKFFAYKDGVFQTKFDVALEDREAFEELARELADWRLGEYLDRAVSSENGIVCKVLHSNQKPILFLPNRKNEPDIPTGKTRVDVEGTEYEANFVKIAVNVLRRPGNPKNELTAVLRRWFGPDAGLPGTNFQVVFRLPHEDGRSTPYTNHQRVILEL